MVVTELTVVTRVNDLAGDRLAKLFDLAVQRVDSVEQDGK
jgi:hypothetical protein